MKGFLVKCEIDRLLWRVLFLFLWSFVCKILSLIFLIYFGDDNWDYLMDFFVINRGKNLKFENEI